MGRIKGNISPRPFSDFSESSLFLLRHAPPQPLHHHGLSDLRRVAAPSEGWSLHQHSDVRCSSVAAPDLHAPLASRLLCQTRSVTPPAPCVAPKRGRRGWWARSCSCQALRAVVEQADYRHWLVSGLCHADRLRCTSCLYSLLLRHLPRSMQPRSAQRSWRHTNGRPRPPSPLLLPSLSPTKLSSKQSLSSFLPIVHLSPGDSLLSYIQRTFFKERYPPYTTQPK